MTENDSKCCSGSCSSEAGLSELREEIDTLDARLLELLAQRRSLSIQVAGSKMVDSGPFQDKQREQAVLIDRIRRGKDVNLDAHYVTNLFQQIIADSVRIQHQYFQKTASGNSGQKVQRIAVVRSDESLSQMAAQKHFSLELSSNIYVSCESYKEILEAVISGNADSGILPIENTRSGGFNDVYDLLLTAQLVIVGEEKVKNPNSEDQTRYIVVSRKPVKIDLRIPCKTSIVMSTAQQAGALVDALSVFKDQQINLSKIESRPVAGNPWEELFYLDFEGNTEDPRIQSALDEVTRKVRFLKVLGCYPAADVQVADVPVAESESVKADSSAQAAPAESKPAVPKLSGKKGYKLASREYKEEDTILDIKGVKVGGNNFTVIAGPCSVESYEQIMACAKEAKENGAHMLRGGCFKPRTSWYSFQGLGYEGLDMLAEAGRTYGLPIVTEVMASEEVERVAQKSDVLQIGARNMQNFPLLIEVGKTQRPILLKRGMSCTIEDLLHACEYILAQGNQQVFLCERGIRTFETATRGTLDIAAVPVLKRLTHLPIIIDPSHAAGERDLVPPLALAAKAVGAHGIIVEFHPEPEKALSDGPQALRFGMFEKMMQDLRSLNVQ
jgi:3-deoxy-7-phosphoheptulonate synthase